ncbi:MAG TPA: glycosyltransferase [Mycobacteriales bacterium]|nr:glycosyltransferase [Mycobacteriales bacterium]
MSRAVTPRVSVIIPTYRRPALLAQCLTSLAGQDAAAGSFEAVVVDDGSGDETPQVLQQHEQRLSLSWCSQASNRGPAAARNKAVALARGDLLLFIDDDVVASPSLVTTHLRLHESTTDTEGVLGYVDWLPSLDVTPFMRWLDTTTFQFAYHELTPGRLPHPADAFYTCNLSMRRRIFEDVGGFDERFPYPAYEDTELACRLAEKGFTLEYRPEALGWHARAITLREFERRMSRVAESAVLWQQHEPDLTISVEGLAGAARPWWRHALLRLLSPLPVRVAGRDLRSNYYWSVIGRGYARGLARAAERQAVA